MRPRLRGGAELPVRTSRAVERERRRLVVLRVVDPVRTPAGPPETARAVALRAAHDSHCLLGVVAHAASSAAVRRQRADRSPPCRISSGLSVESCCAGGWRCARTSFRSSSCARAAHLARAEPVVRHGRSACLERGSALPGSRINGVDRGGAMRKPFISIQVPVTLKEMNGVAAERAEPRDPGACRRR
jgi:hypothetical protein